MRFRLCRLMSFRGFVLCGVALCVSLASGCQVGRRWFQFDSNSHSPTMGIELRADADAAGDSSVDGLRDASGAEVLPIQHVEPEPRRGLRDWLRFPRGEEQIPLPTTTPASDEDGVIPLTGPRPEFE